MLPGKYILQTTPGKRDESDASISKDTPEREPLNRKDSNISASSSVSSMSDSQHRRTSSIGMLSDAELTSTPKSEGDEPVSSPDMYVFS